MNRKTVLKVVLCIVMLTIALSAVAQASSTEGSYSKSTSREAAIEQAKDQQLKPGGKGNYVTWYQQKLKELGYYEGGLSNLYSKRTQDATKEFQQINGLQISGVGNKATRDIAFASTAVSRTEYDIENNLVELKKGATGEQVLQLQGKLIEYGYLSKADGSYDDTTALAVKHFQYANGLTANGVASRETRAYLNEGKNIVHFSTYETNESIAVCKKGTAGLRITQVQQRLTDLGYYSGKIGMEYDATLQKAIIKFKQFNNILPANGELSKSNRAALEVESALSYDEVYGSDTLKPGSSGSAVLQAQYILKDLKYFKGTPNGKYGSSTVTAVKKFQNANKIYPSGVLYSPTLKLLNEKNKLSDVEDARVAAVLTVARAQLGKKYSSCATGPSSFDCSGFTYYVFAKGASKSLPHSSALQGKKGAMVASKSDILPGDLLFFATGSSKSKLNHVGVCYSVEDGNVKFIHASSAAKKVIVSEFKDSSNGNFYGERFLFARRVW